MDELEKICQLLEKQYRTIDDFKVAFDDYFPKMTELKLKLIEMRLAPQLDGNTPESNLLVDNLYTFNALYQARKK